MYKILLTFILFFQMGFIIAQSRVDLVVSNFVNDKGICRACIFNSESSFSGEGGAPVKCVQVQIKNKKAFVSFDELEAGSYAVFLFHDANNNNKMDKNFMGIPKEGYGASRNKLPFASAPSFRDNKFDLPAGKTLQLQVKLRNL